MTRRLVRITVVVALVLGVGVARAGMAAADGPPTVMYVDSSLGSDTNDCLSPGAGEASFNGPCLTIAHAVSLLSEGAVGYPVGAEFPAEFVDYNSVTQIDVAPGTYVEDASIDLNGSSVPSDNLTITCPTCSGPTTAVVEPSAGTRDQSLFVTSGSNVTFTLENLTLEGATAGTNLGPDDGGAIDNQAQGSAADISGLTLTSDVISGFGVDPGGGFGGGVYNENTAAMVLDGTTVTGNTAYTGGGIYNQGQLTITDSSTVSDNMTTIGSGGAGGGIASVGGSVNPTSLAIAGSTVTGNTAAAEGGGIYSDQASLQIDPPDPSTFITDNTSTAGDGGGIWASDEGDDSVTIGIDNADVAGNTALDGDGGGVWVNTTATSPNFATDLVSGNTAPHGDGGGIYSASAQTLTPGFSDDVIGSGASPSLPSACPASSTIAANAANSAEEGGGLYLTVSGGGVPRVSVASSTIDGNCATSGGGGGVYTGFSGVTFHQSTLADNEAIAGDGGGLLADNNDQVSLIDSTVAGNEVVGGAGGGIADEVGSTVTLSFSTVVGNFSAPNGSTPGSAGGIYDPVPVLPSIRPSIVPSGATLDNCSAAAGSDAGWNLEDDSVPQCFTGGETDVLGQDPGLGALQLNEGSAGVNEVGSIPYPPTAIPGDGSPALTVGGPNCGASGNDELGRTRGEPCDIGAVQVTRLAPVRPTLIFAALAPRLAPASGLSSEGSIVAGNYDVPKASASGFAPAAPTVTNVNPDAGPTGGGNAVVVTGTGFSTATGATTFDFGSGHAATGVSCSSTTTCDVTAPAGTSGPVDVTATVGGLTSATNPGDVYTYQAPSSGPPPPVPPSACATSPDAEFVCQAYLDMQGRYPDATGIATWVGGLTSGQLTRTQVALGIDQSIEYRTRLISTWFETYLDRPADPGGTITFLTLLEGGQSDEVVQSELIASPEFAADSGGSTAGFLAALYTDVLGRPIDPVGSTNWGSALSHGFTRQQVALAVLYSAEHETQLVSGWYEKYLHRAADPGGLLLFQTAMSEGVTDEVVIANIVGSTEYFGRLP